MRAIASLSILALDNSSRRCTLALYLADRLAQCAYNSTKSKNKFHLWGSHWKNGDLLIFSLACAQVMYAFVMRSETLPKAYQDFIQNTGPVSELVYKFLKSPFQTSWLAIFGAVRSTTFLSTFVALFQALICLHQKVAIIDHKLVYWISGAIVGLSILLEKKGRRSKLALYVLPRAGDSM